MKLPELSIADLVAVKNELSGYIKQYRRDFFYKMAEETLPKLMAVEEEINKRLNSIKY